MPQKLSTMQKQRHSSYSKLETDESKIIKENTCRCDNAVKETKKIVEQKNNVTTRLLSPKVSFDIIEKPEIDDIDISIFLERIISLFERMMKKLELAASLPIILADPEISKIISEAEMKIVRKACNDLDEDQHHHRWDPKNRNKDQSLANIVDSSSVSRKSFDDSESSTESTCSTTDDLSSSRLYKALEILNSYPAVREKVKVSSRSNEITPQSKLFLQHVKYYIEHCVRRIRLAPVREKIREVHFRKLWQENHKAQQDIDGLMNFLEEQRNSHRDLMGTIGSQYKKDCDTVERLNKKCLEDMKSTVDRSERKQIMEHKNSEMRQNELSQYLAISNNKLDNFRETNLHLEQEIRSKRFKVMSQLNGQIGKFDTEVGERYRILEQLVEQYENDKMRKKKLEEEMKIQWEECSIFVDEIEQKKLSIFREKFDKFVKKRAARIIQYWWRLIFLQIQLQKKKKKPVKKKKKK